MKKQLAFLVLSLIVFSAFFFLPGNRQWASRVLGYGNDIKFQAARMQPEQRMARRFRLDYTLSKQIADSFRIKKIFDPLVLLPPSSSFKKAGLNYVVPEPAVFYYFTGLRTVAYNGPMAMKANYMVLLKGKRFTIVPVTDSLVLKDSITSYLKKGGS